MHIPDVEMQVFIRDLFELKQYHTLSPETKLKYYERLLDTDLFATFIANKFNTAKRFGIEGVQTFVPGVKACID